MIVLKFGGTSVGSVENFKKVARIVQQTDQERIVVLSAMSGVTNTLVGISELLYAGKRSEAEELISGLNEKYMAVAEALLESEAQLQKAKVILDGHNDVLRAMLNGPFDHASERVVLAQGEVVSTNLFYLFMQELREDVELISALDFMRIDAHGEPVMGTISQRLGQLLNRKQGQRTWITQGFICRNEKGEIDNLKRGGSDYSASLIGAAINADQIQIWTDIDGMHNNDPRFVDQTYSIEEISFDEAAELAYFGAKILHPQSIIPAQERNIPVLVKNTFRPEAPGTLIHQSAPKRTIRAIAAKDNITAIKIKSYRMLMAYGFLKKIFEVFEDHKTAIDMITTSEVAVSLTIDNTSKLKSIIADLQGFGNIEVDSDLSIICIAGEIARNNSGITSMIFNCLKEIPIRMISYGGSNYNLSFLVKTSDKTAVLNLLNQGLFRQLTGKEALAV